MSDPRYDPNDTIMAAQGLVWQPWAMGGGQWVIPPPVRLSDADVQRIAEAVVRLMSAKASS